VAHALAVRLGVVASRHAFLPHGSRRAGEGNWFLCRIAAFNPLWPSFLVLYDDGDEHWEDAASVSFRLPPEHVNARSLPTPRPAVAAKPQRPDTLARR
jgi:hypothetical protein